MLGTVPSTGDSIVNRTNKTSVYGAFTFKSSRGMNKGRRSGKRGQSSG